MRKREMEPRLRREPAGAPCLGCGAAYTQQEHEHICRDCIAQIMEAPDAWLDRLLVRAARDPWPGSTWLVRSHRGRGTRTRRGGGRK